MELELNDKIIIYNWTYSKLREIGVADYRLHKVTAIVFCILDDYVSKNKITTANNIRKYLIISIYIYTCFVGISMEFKTWKKICLSNYKSSEIKSTMCDYVDVVWPTTCDILKFQKICKLGESNSIVYLGTFSSEKNAQTFAVKHFKTKNNDTCHFLREIHALGKVSQHDNCVEFCGGWFDHKKGGYIIMRAYPTNLHEHINRVGAIDMKKSRTYFKQLINVVSYAQSLGIAHRDIKPQNIMIDNDGSIKLADWDSSFFTDVIRPLDDNHTNPVCTLFVRPPELLAQPNCFKYDFYKIDIWSIACVFLFTLTGDYIFHGQDEQEVLENILRLRSEKYMKKITWSKLMQTYFDARSAALVESMLHINPTKRISMEELLQHPFVCAS